MYSAAVAASIVSSDFLSKAGTMYIGERVWNRVRRLQPLLLGRLQRQPGVYSRWSGLSCVGELGQEEQGRHGVSFGD